MKTADFFTGENGGNGENKKKIRAGYLAAYRKGRRARRAGAVKAPPYQPANDWRRVFRWYWNQGWEDEGAGRPEKYEA